MAKVKPQKRGVSPSVGFLVSDNAYDMLCCSGYTSLDKNPEIMAGVNCIAQTIGEMSIHIYENTKNGDRRIRNALSRKIDIEPCSYLTRATWMNYIVRNLLLYGDGNSVILPHTKEGLLDDLEPIPAGQVSFVPDGRSYYSRINGVKFANDEIVHIVINPDQNYPWRGTGLRVLLKDFAHLLKQARHTEQKFMEQPKPSIIVKIDSMIEEFANPEGRDQLAKDYVKSSKDGEPWLIPADQFQIEQVRPLTLSDLAIADNIKLNTQAVSAILGVPAFVLGQGEYNKEQWNHFVNGTIKPICTAIQQEITKKLIISPDWYVKFNIGSLLDWDLKTIADVYGALSDRGIVTGNEVRDKMGLSPMPDLDVLRILENYIPVDKTGDQKKLTQGGEE